MLKNKVQFAVLVGGKSSRFGEDKLSHQLNGKTILQYVLDSIEGYSELPILLLGKKNIIPHVGINVYPDISIGSGPLRGIYSALKYTSADYVFILAGDMPFIQSDLIQAMLSYTCQGKKIIIPINKGFYEPLCALYHVSLASYFETFLKQKKYKISDALKNIDTVEISENEWRKYDASGLSFHNINTKSDVSQKNEIFLCWMQTKEIKSRKNIFI